MRSSDPHTDDIELAALQESGLTRAYEADTTERTPSGHSAPGFEANVILIAHPNHENLGTRFRLSPGEVLTVGRNPQADISLPDVPSISRDHARVEHRGDRVVLVDLGSTNGTYLNGQLLEAPAPLASGDRFQAAAVHFKFLHEEDVEHAYYEAISDLVFRDGLTEVYNKRKYEEEAEREFARAVRHHRPLALVMMDLDDFKRINDEFGHLCGDFVLKHVVAEVRRHLRPEQLFARVGGDEFAILTPETGIEGATALAEKLRRRVHAISYAYCEVPVEVQCSFGVAELDDAMSSPQELYVAADEALLGAKREGRDRVGVHPT